MDDTTTELSIDFQATWVIDVLGIFFDLLSLGVCTTSHWQMFGRLMQKLNVCTLNVTEYCKYSKYIQDFFAICTILSELNYDDSQFLICSNISKCLGKNCVHANIWDTINH